MSGRTDNAAIRCPSCGPKPNGGVYCPECGEVLLHGQEARSAATASLVCRSCGRRTNHVHDLGCHSCSPYVPLGTPNSVEVTWWADLYPQTYA